MNHKNISTSVFIKSGSIIGASVILGLLFDWFFYGKVPGISFPLYIFILIAGLFTIASLVKKKINKDFLWLFVPIAFFSIMLFLRSNPVLIFINIAISLFLLLILTEVSFSGNFRTFLSNDFLRSLLNPFRFIYRSIGIVSNLFLGLSKNRNEKTFSQIVKGVLMALPVLFIFILLFSSADLIFQKYIFNIFTFDIEPEFMFRCILATVATVMYIGAYDYFFREKNERPNDESSVNCQVVKNIEGYIFLGSVNVLFFVFILIQFMYLFGGESIMVSQGFTYAEYARRGFFELLAVAVISFVLLLTTEKCIVKKEKNHSNGFKIISSILVAQVFFIVFSSCFRLSLYINSYGFTVARLYAYSFMIFLVTAFCLLLYKIYTLQQNKTFTFGIFILVILFFVGMNLLNPDSFVAKRNIERFMFTDKIDVLYLSMLSYDAIPETIKLIDIKNRNFGNDLAYDFYWKIKDLNEPYLSRWQSLNISRIRAERIFNSRLEQLKTYDDFKAYFVR